MIDTLGTIVLELRNDAAVGSLVGTRVRGEEAAPGDVHMGTDTDPYQAFVVVSTLATPPMPRVPVQTTRLGVRCYGRTRQEAAAVYAACSDAIHHIGPRVRLSNGLGIYISHDDTGGSAARDPDTRQPYVEFVISLLATTQAVAS